MENNGSLKSFVYFYAVILFCLGPESGYRKVIKDDGLEILVLAESSLGAAVGFLKDGSIELQVLEVIIEHSEQFLKLCELINDFKSENLLRKLVDQRSKELRAFRSERDEVYCFIRMCVLIKQGKGEKGK